MTAYTLNTQDAPVARFTVVVHNILPGIGSLMRDPTYWPSTPKTTAYPRVP